jgi:hypothetical protein
VIESLTVQNSLQGIIVPRFVHNLISEGSFFLGHSVLDFCFECHDCNKYSLLFVIPFIPPYLIARDHSVSVCSQFNK